MFITDELMKLKSNSHLWDLVHSVRKFSKKDNQDCNKQAGMAQR